MKKKKSTELVVCSYRPDKPWFKYCMRSITKFASGFSGVTLIVPWDDLQEFLEFEKCTTKDGARLFVKCYHPLPRRGHLSHQAMKMFSDVFCPNADYIAHIDSDSIFTEDANPDDFFENGKPRLYHKPYSSYPSGAPELWWREQTQRALKMDVPNETMSECMQSSLLMYKRNLYKSTRERIEAVNFIPVQEYIVSQKPTPLWGYSEYNTLGSWALQNHEDEYVFIDLSKEKVRNNKVRQAWSQCMHNPQYAEMYKNTIAEFEAILAK